MALLRDYYDFVSRYFVSRYFVNDKYLDEKCAWYLAAAMGRCELRNRDRGRYE